MRRVVLVIVIIIVLAWIIASPDAIALDIRDFFHDVYNTIFRH